MRIGKPSLLKSLLSSGLLNPSIQIPPFKVKLLAWTIASKGDWLRLSLPVGDTIETALDITIYSINAALNALWEAIQIIPNIPDMLAWALSLVWDEISNINSRISNVISGTMAAIQSWANNIYSNINNKINGVSSILQGMIQSAKQEIFNWTPGFVNSAIAAAFLPFRQPLNILTNFADDIQDFFTEPGEWILDKIEDALARLW